MKRCFLVVGILCIIVMLLVGCEGCGDGTPPGSVPETISTPSTPSGPSQGDINEVLTYSTGGSSSSLGHSVEYHFNWGDGNYSDWLSSTIASHSWSSSGNYMVRTQARSSANPDITSSGSGSKSVTIKELSIPLNVRLDYIGVKDAHGGNVQLVVVVGDEDEDKMETLLIPPVEEGFSMDNFAVKEINQRVFHTPSIKGNLKMTILAYHRDQSKTDYLTLINWMKWYYGDNIDWLEQLVLNMPEQDELIGYYEYTWYPDENWGIGGNYSRVGHDDFLVWFSIYPGEEPPQMSQPSLLPDVEIQNVDMPSEVVQSNSGWFYYSWYTNTLTLVNHESCPLTVQWSAVTSAGKEFGSTVTVPAKGKIDCSESYYYENKIGPLEWVYTIRHNGEELDSWSGTMNVIPGPYS